MAETVTFNTSQAAKLFAKLADVQQRSGNYLGVGRYRLRVEAIKSIETREKGPAIAAEFSVLESSSVTPPNGERVVDAGKELAPAHRPGDKVSVLFLLNKGEVALRDVKGFIAAVSGEEFDAVTADHVLGACSEGNPAKGVEVTAKAYNVLTKKGAPFTRIDWAPGA